MCGGDEDTFSGDSAAAYTNLSDWEQQSNEAKELVNDAEVAADNNDHFTVTKTE